MGKTTTEMQLVAVSKLVPYVNNARTHNAQQITKLRSSLREFGFINPVIIDREYNVIAGHGRILAAKEEGIEEVPCVFVDYLTPAQKKAYILADNRMAMDVQGCRDSRTGGAVTLAQQNRPRKKSNGGQRYLKPIVISWELPQSQRLKSRSSNG